MSTFEIVMAIINVVAIITIPIAAVFVGQKLQDRNQKRKDKMAIFQCLMTHRATGWAHQDTVNALNTIDIIFVDDESVRKCWADLFSKYKPNYSTQEITTAQCKLLEAMSTPFSLHSNGFKKPHPLRKRTRRGLPMKNGKTSGQHGPKHKGGAYHQLLPYQ